MNMSKIKKLFLLITLFLISAELAFCYQARTPEQYRRYWKQQYYDKKTGQIVTPMFKSPHERNHYVSEKFICVQDNINKPGYIYVRYTRGRLVKQLENSLNGYSIEPMRCDARYDKYTSVCTKQEATTFQFTEETLHQPHYYFNKCLYEQFKEYWSEPHNRAYEND